jgi:hypothetical protein
LYREFQRAFLDLFCVRGERKVCGIVECSLSNLKGNICVCVSTVRGQGVSTDTAMDKINFTYIYIYICIMYLCMYVCMCVYVCVYIYIYIYIERESARERQRER